MAGLGAVAWFRYRNLAEIETSARHHGFRDFVLSYD